MRTFEDGLRTWKRCFGCQTCLLFAYSCTCAGRGLAAPLSSSLGLAACLCSLPCCCRRFCLAVFCSWTCYGLSCLCSLSAAFAGLWLTCSWCLGRRSFGWLLGKALFALCEQSHCFIHCDCIQLHALGETSHVISEGCSHSCALPDHRTAAPSKGKAAAAAMTIHVEAE